MISLNHLNLAVSHVPELTRLFEAVFGFKVVSRHGSGGVAVLHGEDGFVLVLVRNKAVTPQTYPTFFHAGFLRESREEVTQTYDQLIALGFDAPEPAMLERGSGPQAFGFYFRTEGISFEVSTMSLLQDEPTARGAVTS